VVPEIYHMFQSDNVFDCVELQDPLIVIRSNGSILRVHGGEVIDGNHMWILQVPDDSSPHYYLRYQLCTERHEAVGMGCIPHASMHNSTILSEDIQIELECQDVDLECKDVDHLTHETNSLRGVKKHNIPDEVDLPLTTILEMLSETGPFTISSGNQLRYSSSEPNSSNINSSCICCLHTHLSLVQLSYMMTQGTLC
jgi:hypothetical protein